MKISIEINVKTVRAGFMFLSYFGRKLCGSFDKLCSKEASPCMFLIYNVQFKSEQEVLFLSSVIVCVGKVTRYEFIKRLTSVQYLQSHDDTKKEGAGGNNNSSTFIKSSQFISVFFTLNLSQCSLLLLVFQLFILTKSNR